MFQMITCFRAPGLARDYRHGLQECFGSMKDDLTKPRFYLTKGTVYPWPTEGHGYATANCYELNSVDVRSFSAQKHLVMNDHTSNQSYKSSYSVSQVQTEVFLL